MDVRLTGTDCDESGDYVVPNALVSKPDDMDETVLHTSETFVVLFSTHKIKYIWYLSQKK